MIEIERLKALRIAVVGDVMLDEYWHGDSHRLSPEAPVPVLQLSSRDLRPGGAANVALNLAHLGVGVVLCAVVGDDESARALAGLLRDTQLDCHWEISPGAHTIVKRRLVSRGQQIVRVDTDSQLSFSTPPLHALNGADALLLSDYAKGALLAPKPLIAIARAAGIPVFVDPKTPTFEPYRGATLLTPNRLEFERVVGVCHTLEEKIEKALALIHGLELEALLITLGAQGMLLVCADGHHDYVPAVRHDVFDVTGAGDTVIALMCVSRAAGLSWKESLQLANQAAGIVVTQLGTASVSWSDLRKSTELLGRQKALDEMALAKSCGERLVFTNGCFDLLHVGHVESLEQAKSFGDRLVVGINSDESVRRLKGETRPFVPLADRMKLLSALSCVDWVVDFDEDTPEQLIEAIMPEVLVKGEDYAIEEIVGAQQVLSAGGRVERIPLVPNRSTTGLVERIQAAKKTLEVI